MIKHPLAEFKNITDWAIRAHRLKEETPTLAAMKHDLLREINGKLGTHYKITSMNQWLAETKAVPKDLHELWVLQMIESEIEFEYGEVGTQMMRLIKKPDIKGKITPC